MGNAAEDSNKGIDPSVGALVWVRRRNGSWWPGRIIGPDELPEGCLPSPRSGTPVKLLGREDASVDWYNLEKSKRVKAFRCGEYNDCIEKAKAPYLSKKTVKYARREDAILHALELESAYLGKNSPDFPGKTNTQDDEQRHVNKSPSVSRSSQQNGDDSDSALELSQSGVSFEEPSHVDTIKEGSKRRKTPNDSEDDGIGGAKRMRGLEDLGMGVSSSLKRKRSQVAHVQEFLKRKNRRRTLTKVLECTAMVSIPVVSEQLSSPTESSVPGASESKVSSLESNESKINNTPVLNNSDSTGVSCENANTSRHDNDASLISKPRENEISSMPEIPQNESSDRLFDVPLVAEEKNYAGLSTAASDASQKNHVGGGVQSSESSYVETENNESGPNASGTASVHNLSQMIEKGTSEWQLKGKRNSRSRKMAMDEEAETCAASIIQDSHSIKSKPIPEVPVEELRGWSWKTRPEESHTRLLPYRQSRFTVNPKYDSSDFSLRHRTGSSSLYDITLKVKTIYQSQHVPYISLMSKLHNKPITGHPITVEVLEDGFCDELLSFAECYNSSSELDHHKPNVMVYQRRGRSAGKLKPTKSRRSRKNKQLSKKIRKLSSLTGSQRKSQEKKKPVVEKVKGPSIACVPLKIVFSRINADLTGSIRTAPCLAATGCI